MNLICLPMMPPPALISLAASMSESRTVCSLIAIAPDVEFRNPSLTEVPVTQVSAAAGAAVVAELDDFLSEPHAAAKSDSAARATTSGRYCDFMDIYAPFGSCMDVYERRNGRN